MTTQAPATAPSLAPGVELLGDLSGSGYAETRSLVRRPDGQTLQLTPLLYALLCEVDGQRGPAELAAALSARVGKTAAAEDVEHLLGKLEPLGVLGDGAGQTVDKPNPLLALKLKVVVSDPAVTRRLTTPLAWLFHPVVVVPVLIAFAVTCWFVLVEQGLAQATREAFTTPGMLLGVFALVVVSAGLHELGHAAACRYGGAQPGAMGAGLYVVWPAFYTDVDDSYRLPRGKRLVVDLGGLYFNCVVAVAVMGLWLVTGTEALLLGVAAQLLQMLRQLAPVVRADGYHILADLTGVPDLFAHLKPTLLRLVPWRQHEPSALRRGPRAIVTAWVLVVTPLLLGLFLSAVLLLPRLAATAWSSGREQADLLATAFTDADVLGVGARLLSLVALVLPVAATTYLLVSVVRRLLRWAVRTTAGSPTRRTGAALVGALLVALLAYAWWPAGQYEPVRADERGTLTSVIDARSVAQPTPLAFRRQSALALVPRDRTAPVLLLVRPADGGPVRTVLTSHPAEPGTSATGTVAPFVLPDPPGEGDNQALAVNTTDGTLLYDVAVAMVTVTDGERVDSRNQAVAYASCERCATVAVAFQVVLVVGQSDVQVPVNTAEALNRDCVQCVTAALAKQLVVTLSELPDRQVQDELEAALGSLDALPASIQDLDLDAVLEQVSAVESEVLSILSEAGLVVLPTPTASQSASGSPTSGPGVTTSPGASTSPSPTTTPTAGPSASTSSTVSPTASPSTTSTPSASGLAPTPTAPATTAAPAATASP